MASSLQELPTHLHHLILNFLPDHVSICRLECTCKSLRPPEDEMVMLDQTWNRLYYKQWIIRPDHVQRCHSQSEDVTMTYNKQDFQERYIRDKQTKVLVEEALLDIQNKELFFRVWDGGHESLDVLQSQCSGPNKDLLHKSLEKGFLMAQFERIETLEEFAICFSLFLVQDNTQQNIFQEWIDIRRQMEDLANKIKAKINEPASPHDRLEALQEVFFKEEGFSGNTDNYYNIKNSMIGETLRCKRAIPMTLAILYKCLAERIGLAVDIVGLPGHIIVRIVDVENRYIDVFDEGGRILTLEGVRGIVGRYSIPFQEEYLEPLSIWRVYQRVHNNAVRCLPYPPTVEARVFRILLMKLMREMRSIPQAGGEETCRNAAAEIYTGSALTHLSYPQY